MDENINYLAVCKCGSVVGCISCEQLDINNYKMVISNWMKRGLSICPSAAPVNVEPCTCGQSQAETNYSLKSLRKQLGKTQKGMAELLGLSQSGYVHQENGTSAGSAGGQTVAALCCRFPAAVNLLQIMRQGDLK